MRDPRILLLLVLLAGCDAPASAEQGQNHRVQPGESLFAIAERAYGNGLEWTRIWEANPWMDPDRLRAGEIIYIPPRSNSWGDPPPNPESRSGGWEGATGDDPAPARSTSRNAGILVFHNLKQTVTARTIFGYTLDKALFVLFLCFFAHAVLQTTLVWLAANITFVKDVSFKKSMKAVFMTEMLTFTTLVVVTAVAILFVYVGTDPGSSGTTQLFPTLEGYLRTPAGIALAGLVLLALYITLSLRFLPQAFSVPTSHAITLMALSILIPHLVGAYLIGQRTGLIQ